MMHVERVIPKVKTRILTLSLFYVIIVMDNNSFKVMVIVSGTSNVATSTQKILIN